MIVYRLFQNVIRVLGAGCSLPFNAQRLRGEGDSYESELPTFSLPSLVVDKWM
jgi:hypothetical protein